MKIRKNANWTKSQIFPSNCLMTRTWNYRFHKCLQAEIGWKLAFFMISQEYFFCIWRNTIHVAVNGRLHLELCFSPAWFFLFCTGKKRNHCHYMSNNSNLQLEATKFMKQLHLYLGWKLFKSFLYKYLLF